MKTFGNANYLRLVLHGMFNSEHWNVFHMSGPRQDLNSLPYAVTFENLSRRAKYVSTTKHVPSASSYELTGLSSYLLSGSALASAIDSYNGQGVLNNIDRHVVYYPRWISAPSLFERTMLEMCAYKKRGEATGRYINTLFPVIEFEFDAPISPDVLILRPTVAAAMTFRIDYQDNANQWVTIKTISVNASLQAVAADFSAVTSRKFRVTVTAGPTQPMDLMYFGKRNYTASDVIKPDMDFEWCIAAPCMYVSSSRQLSHLDTHLASMPIPLSEYKLPCLSFGKSDNTALFSKGSDDPFDFYGGKVRHWRIA